MQAFENLSLIEKLRISRLVTVGRAPDDPERAAAAVELAEHYREQSRAYAAFNRWLPLFIVLGLGYVALPRVLEGDLMMGAIYAVVIVCGIGQFMFNPATRPKNLARSLEASRRIAGTQR